MTVAQSLSEIAGQFRFGGSFISAAPHGSGHINDTYLVACDDAGLQRHYLLQRINHLVFADPARVMDNIERVTGHIRRRLEEFYPAGEVNRRVLNLVPTKDHGTCWRDGQGNWWRAYLNIDGAQTYDTPQSNHQAYQAAQAFGLFQKQLSDLPDPPLNEVIPDFHNGPKRFQDFLEAQAADGAGRAKSCRAEIGFLQDHRQILEIVPKLIEQQDLPLRTTHNDTKINNVLFDDRSGEGICVIDLDTVMPGVSLYDFGDLVRSSVSPASEEEPDMEKVTVNMPMYEALLKGYLDSAGEFLTQTEIDHLAFAGQAMSLVIGMRFLTDFLNGDIYFKTRRDNHNLHRCRRQFKLVERLIELEGEMQALVRAV